MSQCYLLISSEENKRARVFGLLLLTERKWIPFILVIYDTEGVRFEAIKRDPDFFLNSEKKRFKFDTELIFTIQKVPEIIFERLKLVFGRFFTKES